MNSGLIAVTIILILSCMALAASLMWVIAWMNQLVLFAMKIYKDEDTNIPPQYAIVPAIFFGIGLFLWRLAEIVSLNLN